VNPLRCLLILTTLLGTACGDPSDDDDDDDVVMVDDDDSVDDDDATDGPEPCVPACDAESEVCVDAVCVCTYGLHDDGLGLCVPVGTCADGYAIHKGQDDCLPIDEVCPPLSCLNVVGWDETQCLYDTAADLTVCDGTSTDPCDTEFTCQAGSCLPAPRTCAPLRPVVLVHGINGSSYDFDIVADRLEDAGWPPEFIYPFDAADPAWGCNVDNADAIAALVDQAMAETCEPRVDLVAHSMGTLSSRYFVKNLGGADLVNSYATLGGMHHGLLSSCFAPDFLNVCVWQEICQWGDFVTQLNAPPSTPGYLNWVSIYGTADETIPNDSSQLDGADNIVMPDVDHIGLLGDWNTWEELEAVLLEPCW
jgi:triacylglycerol lipase